MPFPAAQRTTKHIQNTHPRGKHAEADAQASAQATSDEYKALSKEVLDIKALISSSAKPLAKHPRFNQQSQNPTPETKAEEKKLHGADALRKRVLKRG